MTVEAIFRVSFKPTYFKSLGLHSQGLFNCAGAQG
jgi:hypothetical protein